MRVLMKDEDDNLGLFEVNDIRVNDNDLLLNLSTVYGKATISDGYLGIMPRNYSITVEVENEDANILLRNGLKEGYLDLGSYEAYWNTDDNDFCDFINYVIEKQFKEHEKRMKQYHKFHSSTYEDNYGMFE